MRWQKWASSCPSFPCSFLPFFQSPITPCICFSGRDGVPCSGYLSVGRCNPGAEGTDVEPERELVCKLGGSYRRGGLLWGDWRGGLRCCVVEVEGCCLGGLLVDGSGMGWIIEGWSRGRLGVSGSLSSFGGGVFSLGGLLILRLKIIQGVGSGYLMKECWLSKKGFGRVFINSHLKLGFCLPRELQNVWVIGTTIKPVFVYTFPVNSINIVLQQIGMTTSLSIWD